METETLAVGSMEQETQASSPDNTGVTTDQTPNLGAEGVDGVVTPEVPAYTPNYKFKAADKEHEFDETLKKVIKDQETEAKVRELYEKGHGIDAVKANRQELRTENRQLRDELGAFRDDVSELKQFYAQGDLDSFFQKLQISENVIYQWVVDKAKLKELPPEQQQVYEQKRQASLENRSLEKRLQTLEASRLEAENQGKVLGLQNEFMKPEVMQFAKAFDSKMGKENAFWDSVCELGEYILLRSQGKQNLSPAQAVKHAMETYGKFIDQTQVGGGQAPPAGATQASPVKVIPNIGGKAVSPTARKIKTFEELKEYAKNFSGN